MSLIVSYEMREDGAGSARWTATAASGASVPSCSQARWWCQAKQKRSAKVERIKPVIGAINHVAFISMSSE